MDQSRVNVPLEAAELEALVRLAREECRHPREQARLLIRDQLRRLGLLPQTVTAAPIEAELAASLAAGAGTCKEA